MCLAEEIEDWALAPLRGGKALVGRIERDNRLVGLAGEAAQCMRPEAEKIGRKRGLRLDGALRIGQPIFRHAPEALDRIEHGVGQSACGSARLGGFEQSGERLASLPDQQGEILREPIEIRSCGIVPLRSLRLCFERRRAMRVQILALGKRVNAAPLIVSLALACHAMAHLCRPAP